MNPKIGIVTVLYNSETVLNEFFASLNEQSFQNFILYVIDNKSPDNSLALSRKLAETSTFKTVVIANEENSGVAKGNNIGIVKAMEDDCDMILLSNNDVTLELNTIEILLEGMESQKTNMVVPKIYFYGTNKIWTAGGRFIKHRGCVMHTGSLEVDYGQYNKRRSIGYAPTCFMLIKKEVFNKVGLMDEKYFVYWDDTDFVYRAIKQKESLWYIPESLVHHNESTSTGKLSKFKIYYMCRNLIYFSRKNYSFFYGSYVIIFNMSEHFFKHIFKWKFSLWKEGVRGFIDGFKLSLKRNQ